VDADFYLEPARAAESSFKDRGSRFLGRVIPIGTHDQAAERLAELRKAEWDATHHCWACVAEEVARSSDDGEPSGSAGLPILRQIQARELTGVLVVVTRWYGGTKLGVGGLIRAYGDAASQALDAAGAVRRTRRTSVRVSFDYADTSPALHTIGQFDAEQATPQYDERTHLDLAIRASQIDDFCAAFVDALGGRGDLHLPPEPDDQPST
jgi:uncharacterized YigZ family protein